MTNPLSEQQLDDAYDAVDRLNIRIENEVVLWATVELVDGNDISGPTKLRPDGWALIVNRHTPDGHTCTVQAVPPHAITAIRYRINMEKL